MGSYWRSTRALLSCSLWVDICNCCFVLLGEINDDDDEFCRSYIVWKLNTGSRFHLKWDKLVVPQLLFCFLLFNYSFIYLFAFLLSDEQYSELLKYWETVILFSERYFHATPCKTNNRTTKLAVIQAYTLRLIQRAARPVLRRTDRSGVWISTRARHHLPRSKAREPPDRSTRLH